jgi:hypothetical protein
MRPALTKNIPLDSFRNYYWLKAELVEFCRNSKLSSSGGKKELKERIEYYLNTDKNLAFKEKPSKKRLKLYQAIALEGEISEHYKNDEVHRDFFKSIIGERFKFNVPFMKWMKSNSGKTYQEAVNEWLKIEAEKKSGKKYEIDSQFEYNQYTRDFFRANQNKCSGDVIKCWKYKKSLPGTNKYEFSDLEALK